MSLYRDVRYNQVSDGQGKYANSLVRRKAGPKIAMDGSAPKFFDKSTALVDCSAPGYVLTSLCDMAAGGSAADRVGREIVITRIQWQACIRCPIDFGNPAATRQSFEYVRFITILDSQCNGTAPDVSTYLAQSSFLGLYNLNNQGRFIVLDDHVAELAMSACAPAGLDPVQGEPDTYGFAFFNSKSVNIPILYSDSNAGIASVASNNIFVIAVAASNIGTEVKFSSRVRFVG